MKHVWIIVMLLAVAVGSWSFARPNPNTISTMPSLTLNQATPGARQPIAPGFRKVAALSKIKLVPRIRELAKLEYLSNGHIEVAGALVLVPSKNGKLDLILPLAQMVVKQAFGARPSLAEVDVSVYRREDYAGFGGPLPYFTASVPRARLAEFLNLKPGKDDYDRLWVNPNTPEAPEIEATGATDPTVKEIKPKLEGSSADVQTQRALKLEQAQNGFQPSHLVYYHGSPNSKRVALTIDDAVHPIYAPLVLDALKFGGGKATFFLVGRNVEAYPYFVRDLVKDGHELANHTYHHVRLNNLSNAAIRTELARANRVISAISGKPVRFFRPPGGRYSSNVLKIARQLGMTTAFWTDDPGDFNNLGATVLENRLLRRLHPGAIVLLHDNAQQTAPILVDLLQDARAAGFEMVTLSTQAGL